jgi:multidrug efflux system outer membrane protein
MPLSVPLKQIALSLIFCLAACNVGPDFGGVETPLDEEVQSYANQPEAPERPQKEPYGWWKQLGDPQLETQVKQLLDGNLSLMQAAERMLQANARLAILEGQEWPTLGASSGATRSITPPGVIGFPDKFYNTVFDAGLSSQWQIDLFGRIRRQVEAAEASLAATEEDKNALTHSLIAQLVTRHIAIYTQAQQANLAQQAVENRQRIKELVKRRYDLGVRNTVLEDYYLSEDNFRQANADALQFERLLIEERYLRDVLLGKPPGMVEAKIVDLTLPEFSVPVCLPAKLIDRRPDLRASLLRVEAANAEIGVAVADLYPQLNLSGNGAFRSQQTANIFRADQLASSIAASLTARLFEGGALRAAIRLEEAETRELAAAYAEQVLEALREVETALMNETKLAEQLKQREASFTALNHAEALSQERYVSGILGLRDYLETQQRRYAAAQNLLLVKQQYWNNRIALYLALGGDWLGEETDKEACESSEEKVV